jgi:hypothetical protein
LPAATSSSAITGILLPARNPATITFSARMSASVTGEESFFSCTENPALCTARISAAASDTRLTASSIRSLSVIPPF